MKPRKELESDIWKNPNFDKGIVAPAERFLYMCEQKGLKVDGEVEEWLYEVIRYAYKVGSANYASASFESFLKNTREIYRTMNKDTEEELKNIHKHFNEII